MQLSATRTTADAEDGVSAVIVAMLMVVLLGVAAMGIDYTSAVNAQTELDTATDSTAAQVGRDCALQFDACASDDVQAMVKASLPNATATSSPNPLRFASSDSVTVTASNSVKTPLAAFIGNDATTVQSRTTVSWNYVADNGPVMVPFGVDYCTWKPLSPTTGNRGTQVTLGLGADLASHPMVTGCSGVPGTTYTDVPSLDGYVLFLHDSNTQTCDVAAISRNATLSPLRFANADFSKAMKVPCVQSMVQSLSIGQTVFLPIYAVQTPTFATTWTGLSTIVGDVRIIGFAPFYINGFLSNTGTQLWTCSIGATCRGIEGYFVITTRVYNGWSYVHVARSLNFGAIRVTRTE